MRCRDAKQRLTAQRVTEPDRSEFDVLHAQERVKRCAVSPSNDGHQTHLDTQLKSEPGRFYPVISTERIMQAVDRERRVSQQLEHIQSQQQARLAWMRKMGRKVATGAFLATVVLVLGLFALFLFQPEVFMSLLSTLGGVVDALYALAGIVQAGLTLISSHSWLLSGFALGVVIMMAIWLLLMRSPREA